MEPGYPLLSVLIVLLFACRANVDRISVREENIAENTMADTVLLGDFNSDGVKDSAFVVTYGISDATGMPMGEGDDRCRNAVLFSGGIPAVSFDRSVFGQLGLANDLNGDHIQELIFAAHWYIGTRSRIYVISLSDNKWKILDSSAIRLHDPEDFVPDSIVVKRNNGWFIRGLQYSDGDETDYFRPLHSEQF